jgi:hypothetical protein
MQANITLLRIFNRFTFREIAFLLFQIIVQDVNDNCPILPRPREPYNFTPVPPLVQAAFFTIKATDLDSDENARISYYPQRITET